MTRAEHIRFVKPHKSSLCYIAEHMRKTDIFECWAVGLSPYEALTISVDECGDEAWVILADGEPIGAMGAKPAPRNGAIFWLLGTDGIYRHRRDFFRKSLQERDRMLRKYEYLTNIICLDNKASKRWLTRLGAKFYSKTVLLGREFQQFYIWR